VVLSSGFPSDVVGRKLDSAVIVAFTPDQSAFAVRLDCELKYPFALTVSWNSLHIKGRRIWIGYLLHNGTSSLVYSVWFLFMSRL
jgi:hypothetical protein